MYTQDWTLASFDHLLEFDVRGSLGRQFVSGGCNLEQIALKLIRVAAVGKTYQLTNSFTYRRVQLTRQSAALGGKIKSEIVDLRMTAFRDR